MKKYSFLYWIDESASDDKVSIVEAKTIRGACGKFIRNHATVLSKISIDYEVGIIGTSQFINISEIGSVKEYLR